MDTSATAGAVASTVTVGAVMETDAMLEMCAFADEIGWIGFDPANRVCPTSAYVRLASGLDARYAAPLRGIRHGHGVENLSVEVVVTQTQQ